MQAAFAEGPVLLRCGVHANTIHILNPLTIPDPVPEDGISKLGRALTRADI